MSNIYILIPHGVRTGGPEALHQLSDSLLRQGQANTFIVYYHVNQIASLRAMALERRAVFPGLRFAMGDSNVPEYATYLKQVREEVPNVAETIVVLPEVLADISSQFDRSQVLLWWLSVDNAFGSLARINLNLLRRDNIWHATQSAYARRFIESLGFRHAGALTDYTSDLFGIATVVAERPMRIALNAGHKVIIDLDDLSARLQAAIPGLDIRRIVGLSREQVLETLQTSRVFIDLGNFPGKDRLAREAARLGCAIVVADVGAGATAEDYDTDEADRIDPWNLERVVERVRQLALKPAVAQENNQRLLAQISTERDGFDAEVKALMTLIHTQLRDLAGSRPATGAADP